MQESLHSKQEIAAYFQALPAEQVKKAVLDLIMGSKKEDLNIFMAGIPEQFNNVEPERELSPAEKARAFREWAESHHSDAPPLSDEAISRESIYSHEGLERL